MCNCEYATSQAHRADKKYIKQNNRKPASTVSSRDKNFKETKYIFIHQFFMNHGIQYVMFRK